MLVIALYPPPERGTLAYLQNASLNGTRHAQKQRDVASAEAILWPLAAESMARVDCEHNRGRIGGPNPS